MCLTEVKSVIIDVEIQFGVICDVQQVCVLDIILQTYSCCVAVIYVACSNYHYN